MRDAPVKDLLETTQSDDFVTELFKSILKHANLPNDTVYRNQEKSWLKMDFRISLCENPLELSQNWGPLQARHYESFARTG